MPEIHDRNQSESVIRLPRIPHPSPLMGNNGEIFKLLDGSLWEVLYEYECLYEYIPAVIICPGQEKLLVAGKSLSVKMLAASSGLSKTDSTNSDRWEIFEETNLEGSIRAWFSRIEYSKQRMARFMK